MNHDRLWYLFHSDDLLMKLIAFNFIRSMSPNELKDWLDYYKDRLQREI
jgi:hypothetical protein